MVNIGDIILLDTGFTDKTGSKVRPCLVIAKHQANYKNNCQKELTYLEISSQDYLKDYKYTCFLSKIEYKLKHDSYVKIWKIKTIDEVTLPDSASVHDKLKQEDLNKVLEKLREYFKIPAERGNNDA